MIAGLKEVLEMVPTDMHVGFRKILQNGELKSFVVDYVIEFFESKGIGLSLAEVEKIIEQVKENNDFVVFEGMFQLGCTNNGDKCQLKVRGKAVVTGWEWKSSSFGEYVGCYVPIFEITELYFIE